MEEFKVYLNLIAPGVSEDKIAHSFDTINTNRNGEISREEFLAAAQDFLIRVNETELSENMFYIYLLLGNSNIHFSCSFD